MNILKRVRQGDMIFYKVENADLTMKQNTERLVVGIGEVSGHSHDIFPVNDSTVLELAESENSFGDATRDQLFFEVKGEAVVLHEEHAPVTLDEGMWVRINQVNYDPFKNELEKVRD